jgi:hypothetical protein
MINAKMQRKREKGKKAPKHLYSLFVGRIKATKIIIVKK